MGPSNLQTRVTKHISHLVSIDIPYVIRVGYVGEDVPMSLNIQFYQRLWDCNIQCETALRGDGNNHVQYKNIKGNKGLKCVLFCDEILSHPFLATWNVNHPLSSISMLYMLPAP